MQVLPEQQAETHGDCLLKKYAAAWLLLLAQPRAGLEQPLQGQQDPALGYAAPPL